MHQYLPTSSGSAAIPSRFMLQKKLHKSIQDKNKMSETGKIKSNCNSSDGEDSLFSTTQSAQILRRRWIRDTWKSIKRSLWNPSSLPKMLDPRGASLVPPPSNEICSFDHHLQDVEEGAFCDSMIELMWQCPRFHYLLTHDQKEFQRSQHRTRASEATSEVSTSSSSSSKKIMKLNARRWSAARACG